MEFILLPRLLEILLLCDYSAPDVLTLAPTKELNLSQTTL